LEQDFQKSGQFKIGVVVAGDNFKSASGSVTVDFDVSTSAISLVG
jgi:hypothetical protein